MPGWTLLLALALTGSAPAQTIASPQVAVEPAAPVPALAMYRPYAAGDIPAAAEIMALPEPLRRLLHERVVKPGGSQEQRMVRLVELVFDEQGLALQYDLEATRTVAEVWRDRRANCLSFTLLVVAMAREVGLDARVRELGESIAWYQQEGVVYNVDHVNVGIRIDGRTHVVDLDRNILLSRHRPRLITDPRAIAHFHNNRGAELLASGDLAQAQLALEAALELAPDFVPAWSNLGVVLQRRGLQDAAGEALQTAYALDPGQAATLRNLSNYYLRTDRPAQAATYIRRLDQFWRNDPFHHFSVGLACEHEGDLACAIRHYRHAIRLQPGEHQFHFGLARAYALSGDLAGVRRELAKAAAATSSESVRSLYARKLQAVQTRHGHGPEELHAR